MKYVRRVHKTPRPLLADAYTIGANQFQSKKAKKKSVYYITYRRELNKIDSFLYDKGDDRMFFIGLQRISDDLFFEPIEQWEIDQTKAFLEYAKVTTRGFKRYYFPEKLWQEVVDKFGGRVPIKITAMPEGSVVYTNETIVEIENLDENFEGFGEFAAYFESKLLQCWAGSERVTQDMHMYDKIRTLYKNNFPHLTQEEINFYASLAITDFGDRAGMNGRESEDQGMYGLYTFSGTDTFCGAYQAWMNSDKTPGLFSSVYALAHRNVQAYDNEEDAYIAIYNACEDGDIASMVNDCYSSENAVLNYHVKLALQSKKENNGKIVVSRADSGDAIEETMRIINAAIANDLKNDVIYPKSDRKWIEGTYLHALEGDGLSNEDVYNLFVHLIDNNLVPWTWFLTGQGGGKRNHLKRDDLSAKYALCAVGKNYDPVVKFSDTFAKTTLPGPTKLLRSEEALKNKKTIVFRNEEGEDARVIYYNGLEKEDFFDVGMLDNFNVIKERIHKQFDTMPKTMTTVENHGYPASDAILTKRRELLEKYAPSKNQNNY